MGFGQGFVLLEEVCRGVSVARTYAELGLALDQEQELNEALGMQSKCIKGMPVVELWLYKKVFREKARLSRKARRLENRWKIEMQKHISMIMGGEL